MRKSLTRKISPKGILIKSLEDVNKAGATNFQRAKAMFDFILQALAFLSEEEIKSFIKDSPDYMKWLFKHEKYDFQSKNARDVMVNALTSNHPTKFIMNIYPQLTDMRNPFAREEGKENAAQVTIVKLSKMYHWIFKKIFDKKVLDFGEEIELPIDVVLPEPEKEEEETKEKEVKE